MKFILWFSAGFFLLLNCVFFFRYLWQEGVEAGLVLGSAIIALGLSLSVICFKKGLSAFRDSK
jgi:hypothetical protein